jgi:selenocysteine lyase/cysteine desulfurase
MIRVSFGIYNDEKEVDYFLEAIENIQIKGWR